MFTMQAHKDDHEFLAQDQELKTDITGLMRGTKKAAFILLNK